MKHDYLVECPNELCEGLKYSQSARESFTTMNFFLQRSICNYVAKGATKVERKERVKEVVYNLEETQKFSIV